MHVTAIFPSKGNEQVSAHILQLKNKNHNNECTLLSYPGHTFVRKVSYSSTEYVVGVFLYTQRLRGGKRRSSYKPEFSSFSGQNGMLLTY